MRVDEKLVKSGALVALLLILTAALVMAPKAYDTRRDLLLARQALDFGEPLQAAEYLARAAAQAPQSGWWSLAGRYAWQGQDPRKAAGYLQRAGSLDFEEQMLLGDALRQTGDLKAAEQVWQAVARENDSSVDVYQRLLELHQETGDIPAEIQDLRAITTLRPYDAGTRYRLGLLMASQDPETALGHLTQAAELNPQWEPSVTLLKRRITSARRGDSPSYSLLGAGRALADLGHWDLAAEAFRRSTEMRPDYAEAWAYLGEARQHSPLQAENAGWDELQRALQLDPDSLAARSFLALYWERQGDYSKAAETYREALTGEPDNPVLQASYARQQALLGDLSGALASYRRAVELAPRDPRFLGTLVDFSLEYDVDVAHIALPAARRAVLLSPKNPVMLVRMAHVFLKLEDQASAERFLSRALDLAPEDPEVHLGYARLHLLRGDLTSAQLSLLQVSVLAPDSPAAGQSRRLLQAYFP